MKYIVIDDITGNTIYSSANEGSAQSHAVDMNQATGRRYSVYGRVMTVLAGGKEVREGEAIPKGNVFEAPYVP